MFPAGSRHCPSPAGEVPGATGGHEPRPTVAGPGQARAEAQQLLAPICDWFTEGFDTADLREAKGLLEALPCSSC